ncbi:hypothetical protein DZF91_09145 [Actinomadura logoneensis]|uniref:XRE family transcriptional regulator n=1 Tax=Actinomadura logoneensis TaxID=2293572 RepID=A0A372JRF4_9ACTN|nr:hypothetical protein [Actinomadura logoneensis]RFU41938.1 hypothetical protein DZF91_09145 [Actinomadura logoneensis]
MADRALPTWAIRLRTLREAHGWGLFETARRLFAACGVQNPPPTKVKSLARQVTRHERGQVVPTVWADVYALVYGLPDSTLILPSPRTVEAQSDGDEDDVRRRELLQHTTALVAGTAAAPALAVLSEAWQASQPKVTGSTVSRAMLDDWAGAYAIHAQGYVRNPPALVLAGLARDWAEMAPHLAKPQPDVVKRDLAHTSARLARLIAGTVLQLGDRRMAGRWWITARSLADASGDRLLASYTRSWEVTSRVTGPDEDPRELLGLAAQARRLAGRRPTATLLYATAVEAEVLAFQSRHRDAQTMMRHAERVFETIPASDPAGTREELLRFDQVLVLGLSGSADRVEEPWQAARRYYGTETHLYNAAQLDLYRLAAHAQQDPVEVSRQALSLLTGLPAECRIDRVALPAAQVVRALPEGARDLPAAQELWELISHR